MIQKLLIANRGEIACRIIRTAREMGIATVAVYSDADARALHVRQADEAVHIGPSPAAESYLLGEKIIAAAQQTGAEAIHPGYGFLSENAGFAQAVIDAGLIWVGPKPSSIEAMGLKDAAKKLMRAAGVPVTPGYEGEDQSVERLKQEAMAAANIDHESIVDVVNFDRTKEGAVFIVMGKTDAEADRHKQQSMILVPRDAKGLEIVRHVSTFGYNDAPFGEAEIVFRDVRVPAESMLLGH